MIPSPTSCLKSGAGLSDSCQPQSALVLKVHQRETAVQEHTSHQIPAFTPNEPLCAHFSSLRKLSATIFFTTLCECWPPGAAQYNDSH